MNICYSTNENFAKYTAVSIVSILENNTQYRIVVHILYSSLSDAALGRFLAFENRYDNVRIVFHRIDSGKFEKFNLSISHITKETYFRYLIPELFPDIDKILYLDGDTVVNGDISDLFKINLSGYCCAGVRDIYIEEIGHKKSLNIDGVYINAGVILFNLSEIRNSGAISRLFNITRERRFKFQDQDAINVVFNGKIKELDCIYNFKRAHQKQFREKIGDARIIHYVGPSKPWKKFTFNKLKRLYFKYERISPFKKKKIKVGLLVDEYFGEWRTAFGGYGFLAKEIIAKHLPCSDIELEVILGKQKNNPFWASSRVIEGIKVWRLPRLEPLIRRWLRNSDFDCWLSIEMCYDFVLRLDPNRDRKLILWIQDPRPKWVWEKIGELKKIEDHCFYNQRIYDEVGLWNRKKRVKFITQGIELSPLANELYSLPKGSRHELLSNPVKIDYNYNFDVLKKEKIVLFIGRLEAQKRAWIFCEIAKLMPEYQFYVMGRFYRYHEENRETLKGYMNGEVRNLHFCGHLSGNEKAELLKKARVLVSTSIWEGIPIAWLEALSYGLAIVSDFDRENLASRFGKYVGEISGDGENRACVFCSSINLLMNNDLMYEKIAKDAIQYIKMNHNFDKFEHKIRNIVRKNFY